jgi:hypothetical protein
MTMLHEAPTVIAYFGDSNSCQRHKLYAIDWLAVQSGPDKAKWAASAQSGTILDRTRSQYANGSAGNTLGQYPWTS